MPRRTPGDQVYRRLLIHWPCLLNGIQWVTYGSLSTLVQMSPVALFFCLLWCTLPVCIYEVLRDVMKTFCSVVNFGVSVPSDDTPHICSISYVHDDLVDSVCTLLRPDSIGKFFCERRCIVFLRDWAVTVASTAWGQRCFMNWGDVPRAVLDYFKRSLTNINHFVKALLRMKQFIVTLSWGTLCYRLWKPLSVEEYLVSIVNHRDEANTLFVVLLIPRLCHTNVLVDLLTE